MRTFYSMGPRLSVHADSLLFVLPYSTQCTQGVVHRDLKCLAQRSTCFTNSCQRVLYFRPENILVDRKAGTRQSFGIGTGKSCICVERHPETACLGPMPTTLQAGLQTSDAAKGLRSRSRTSGMRRTDIPLAVSQPISMKPKQPCTQLVDDGYSTALTQATSPYICTW